VKIVQFIERKDHEKSALFQSFANMYGYVSFSYTFSFIFFFPKPVSVSVSVLNSFVPTRLSKDARLLRKKTQSKGKRDFNKIYFIAKLFFTKLRAPAKRAKCKLLVRAPSQNTWRRLFAVKTPAACADARSVSEQHLTLVLIQPSPMIDKPIVAKKITIY